MRDWSDEGFYGQSSKYPEQRSEKRILPASHISQRFLGVILGKEIHMDMKSSIYVRMRVSSTHLLQVLVTVDELALVGVLQFVGLHVLPQSLDNDRPGLGVDPEHASQPGVQLKLRGLDENKRNVRSGDFSALSHSAEKQQTDW